MSFPNSKEEALALVYVQAQNLKGKAPSELVEIYEAALSSVEDASGSSSLPFCGVIAGVSSQ